jgi:cellulose biosynthesis protein BcsQ
VILCSIPQPKTRLARQLIQYVEETCRAPDGRTLKFATDISRTVILQEAQRIAQTIFQYNPTHHVAEQYLAVARELETRIDQVIKSYERKEGVSHA